MSFLDRFTKGGLKVGETKETIIKQLLGKGDYETATEIPNVLAMVALDLIGMDFANSEQQRLEIYQKRTAMKFPETKKMLDAGDYLWFIGDRFRIDAIPHGRKARLEAVTALKGVEEAEVQKRRALAGMFS